MIWSKDSKPNDVSHYDHTICKTPLGDFIIEWKSWKESPSYDVMLNDEWIGNTYKIDDAKEMAKDHLVNIYNELGIFLNI